MTDLEIALKQAKSEVSSFLSKHLEQNASYSIKLNEATSYSLLSGGKMLRPFLCLTFAELLQVPKARAIRAAAALEMVHVFSLIHDDLPALDNDHQRRGKNSCHIEFDEATAILTGDLLLTMAYGVLASESTHDDPEIRCKLISNLTMAIAEKGMIAGQMLDMDYDFKNSSIEQIIKIQKLKTASLFGFSCQIAPILANSEDFIFKQINGFAENFGLAFQIIDDIEDFAKSPEEEAKKPNIVSKIGFQDSITRAKKLLNSCKENLSKIDNSQILEKLIEEFFKRINEVNFENS